VNLGSRLIETSPPSSRFPRRDPAGPPPPSGRPFLFRSYRLGV